MKKLVLAMIAVFAFSVVAFADDTANAPAGNTNAPAATEGQTTQQTETKTETPSGNMEKSEKTTKSKKTKKKHHKKTDQTNMEGSAPKAE